MNVSSANQSKEARPQLPVEVTHSYIFATGGLGISGEFPTSMYAQIIFDFITSMFSMLINAY